MEDKFRSQNEFHIHPIFFHYNRVFTVIGYQLLSETLLNPIVF
jgi:hypothetical protein